MPEFRSMEVADEITCERQGNHATGHDQETLCEHRTYGMVGTSERMLDVYGIVARIAPTTSTVLIQGETRHREGADRARHPLGEPRAPRRPFVTVDCSALAETLLESELFGHVKGAFTGALTDKRGFFEAADGRHAASSTRSAR